MSDKTVHIATALLYRLVSPRYGVGMFLIIFSMLNFSLVTLNVNGLRDDAKCTRIVIWCKLVNVDVVFFQELFLSSADDFRALKDILGGVHYFSPLALLIIRGV